MTQRTVRFASSFFRALDAHFPEARSADGQPSATDFLVFDLPPVRDLLAADLEGYHLFHAARADLLQRLGRPGDAAAAYDEALARTANGAERDLLQRQRRALPPPE